jgi:hypothetical protein
MKTSIVIVLLTVMLGASLFSLSGSAQTALASLADIRTPIDRFPEDFTFPCARQNPPWWCHDQFIDPIDLGECRCPDVVIPENFPLNETIVIETIPGRVSDTLQISKVLNPQELNPQPLPPGEGNITLNR